MINVTENNDQFVKEFEYFKDNPNEYQENIANYIAIGSSTLILITVAILLFNNNSNPVILNFILIIILLSLTLYGWHSDRYKRALKFNKSFYEGKLSELFDLESETFSLYTEIIKNSIKEENGITGGLVYWIYYVQNQEKSESQLLLIKHKKMVDEAVKELEEKKITNQKI